MPYSVLEQKMKLIPKECYEELDRFLDFLIFSKKDSNPSNKKRIGIAKGVFTVPENFDKWDSEILEDFGESL